MSGEIPTRKLLLKEEPKEIRMKIPITKPFFDNDDKENILKPFETGWLVQGPYVAEFEKIFAGFTGSKFAKASTSCTTALHLALEALGMKEGDKIVIPSFTYVASANAVEYTGAEVVFCDIDLRTFNVDINKLEEIFARDKNKKIKAVMPVNLFGLCAKLPEIIKLAKKYKFKVVEDCACSLGAFIGNKHSGTFGDAGCFSFHPRKAVTTGEGGMIVTDSKDTADKISILRDHGAGRTDIERSKSKGGSLLPEFNVRGYNYRMTDIQGALGVSQMKKAGAILEKRKAIAEKYNEALKGVEELLPPFVPKEYRHGYQSYVCIFTGGEDISKLSINKINKINSRRNKIMQMLEENGIATRQGTHAVHTLGYYKNKYRLKDEDYINSYAADRLSISFPLYPQMSEEEFNYVVDNLREVLVRCVA